MATVKRLSCVPDIYVTDNKKIDKSLISLIGQNQIEINKDKKIFFVPTKKYKNCNLPCSQLIALKRSV